MEEYQCFIENDEQFAEKHGKNIQLFRKNKANIDFEKLNYDFVKLCETIEYSNSGEWIAVAINNPYQLKIRLEKQIAEVLGLSRSQVKSLLEKGEILIMQIETQRLLFAGKRRIFNYAN